MNQEQRQLFRPRLGKRRLLDQTARLLFAFAVVCAIGVLVWMIFDIVRVGAQWISIDFFTNFPSRFPAQAGIKSALFGSAWLIIMTVLIAVPIGVGAAVYFEEFAKRSRWHSMVEINIANLAGVPAILYGLLGLTVFVRFLHFDRSLLAGAATMALLILPPIILTAREALKAVPQSIRHAALAVGATHWQAVRAHVLPAAIPGIATGLILSVARALGEAAPMILLGALAFVAFVPTSPFDNFTILPVQIFNWASRPQAEFQELAAAGILVLLALLISTNAIAVYWRWRMERKIRW